MFGTTPPAAATAVMTGTDELTVITGLMSRCRRLRRGRRWFVMRWGSERLLGGGWIDGVFE